MKLHLIMFKNLKIRAYTNPNFTDIDPDIAATQLERSLILNAEKPEVLSPYKNLEMFYIGDFDDQTGKFTTIEPVLLCSPREIIISLEAKALADKEASKEAKELC